MQETLALLPPAVDLETVAILRKTAQTHRYLAELKGASTSIPNRGILINALVLQEAKESSAIENIITTQDELYKEATGLQSTPNAKEVSHYAAALQAGYQQVVQNGVLSQNHILTIHESLEQNRAGFRKLPGTGLINQRTGETVYTPPQHPEEIVHLMDNLVMFINNDDLLPIDPLIKMALLHYQFESIHPFYDGNGRTGRILNVLYLMLKGLLDLPILYMSREIILSKDEYYRLLQSVRDEHAWEQWVLYMLDIVQKTAIHTLQTVHSIKGCMQSTKHFIRERHAFYSQDLINHLFEHPYTKIALLQEALGVSRLTARRYLEILYADGVLQKERIGRNNCYINRKLIDTLQDFA